MRLEHAPSRALAVAIFVALARPASGVDCSQPVAFQPIGTLRVHRDFVVDYRASLNRVCPRTILFAKLAGPPEFDLDGAGGLFYWTPARTGTETITIQVTEEGGPTPSVATATFQAIVDDNTIGYPLFSDYLAQPATVPIVGRAAGADFVWPSPTSASGTPGASTAASCSRPSNRIAG